MVWVSGSRPLVVSSSPLRTDPLPPCSALQWGVSVLLVRGRELRLKRMHFTPIVKAA